jgi:hypothetical protein
VIATIHRLHCDLCSTKMKGRVDEPGHALRERAQGAGWRQTWHGTPTRLVDVCQVCSPRMGEQKDVT